MGERPISEADAEIMAREDEATHWKERAKRAEAALREIECAINAKRMRAIARAALSDEGDK